MLGTLFNPKIIIEISNILYYIYLLVRKLGILSEISNQYFIFISYAEWHFVGRIIRRERKSRGKSEKPKCYTNYRSFFCIPCSVEILFLEHVKITVNGKDNNIWHRWFSGRMLACHAGGPGSIPGRCIFWNTIMWSDEKFQVHFFQVWNIFLIICLVDRI